LGPDVEIQVSCSSPRLEQEAGGGDDATSLELAHQLAALCKGQLAISNEGGVFLAALTIPATEQLPVLVIDDNADTLQLLRRYTADTRYRLITTQHPEHALALAERLAPQIIVLDVMMPGVDGWEILAQLRQHPLTSDIPIVVCTIMAQEEMALTLGASGFVRKPVTRQAFLVALDQQVTRPQRCCPHCGGGACE
ncbi:MAG: response regulator, partial [Anaerolineae bacterium]|nr:response regulator [Anaerolineae bacterium]